MAKAHPGATCGAEGEKVSALVFVPLRNSLDKKTGKHKRDADEFLREAHAFNRAHEHRDGVNVFDNQLPNIRRREELLRRLRNTQPGELDVLAVFCHGWPTGIQLGFSLANVRGLAKELKTVAAPKLTVALYCCSTGADDDGSDADETKPGPGGDGGFADKLRDELCELGIAATVFAHSLAGHTTRLPYVRVFEPAERAGGRWVVSPDSPLWPAWRRWLSGDGRFRYPFLSQAELERELREG